MGFYSFFSPGSPMVGLYKYLTDGIITLGARFNVVEWVSKVLKRFARKESGGKCYASQDWNRDKDCREQEQASAVGWLGLGLCRALR